VNYPFKLLIGSLGNRIINKQMRKNNLAHTPTLTQIQQEEWLSFINDLIWLPGNPWKARNLGHI